MPAAMVILAAAGTALSAYGQVQSGRQQQQALEYNADVNRQNAIATEKQSSYEQAMKREEAKRTLSTQRAQYGMSGVDLEGSPLLVMADTAKEGELDAQAIKLEGEIKAQQYRSKADLLEWQGKNAAWGGMINAGTSILTGASRTIGSYGSYGKKRG